MARTEKALVMRDVPLNGGNGHALVLPDDPPTAALQLIHEENRRLREQVTQLHVLLLESQQGVLKQLAQANDAANQAFDLRIKLAKQIEDTLDRKEERREKRERSKAELEIYQRLGEGLIALAPSLVNKLAGTKVSEAEARTLQPLIASIRPEQWERLLGVLDPEQTIALKAVVDAMPDSPLDPIRKDET